MVKPKLFFCVKRKEILKKGDRTMLHPRIIKYSMYLFVVRVIIKRKMSVTNRKISDQTDLYALCLIVFIRSTTCTFHRISYNNTTLRGLGYLLTQRLSYAHRGNNCSPGKPVLLWRFISGEQRAVQDGDRQMVQIRSYGWPRQGQETPGSMRGPEIAP